MPVVSTELIFGKFSNHCQCQWCILGSATAPLLMKISSSDKIKRPNDSLRAATHIPTTHAVAKYCVSRVPHVISEASCKYLSAWPSADCPSFPVFQLLHQLEQCLN